MLFALLAIPALPTGRGPIFAPAPTPDVQTLEPDVVCYGDTTLAEALQQGCTEVTEFLTDGGASGDVNLPSLRKVGGGVRGGIKVQRNPNLVSLTMPNLVNVFGTIVVEYNPNLASLTMDNLWEVSNLGSFVVRGNTNLASLAMPNLSDLYGYIDVHNNAKLASLTMNNLFLVDGGIISVKNNTNLVSLAMPNLEEANAQGGIIVLDNPNLASLTMPSLGGGSWWNIIVDPKPATCNVGLYTC